MALFFLIVTGLYHSTDFNGARVLMLFVLFTFYVIVLQLMWRFDNKSKKHFIDAINVEQSSLRVSSEPERRDNGMNYFDEECEIEITKAGGFRQRDDSIATLEHDDEIRRTRSMEFETAQFPGLKDKSNVNENISFKQFQTKPVDREVDNEEHSSFDIEVKRDNIKKSSLSEKNENPDFFNDDDNKEKSVEDENDKPVEFGYQEFRDIDEDEEDNTQYEFDAFHKSKEGHN